MDRTIDLFGAPSVLWRRWRKLGLAAGSCVALLANGCGGDDEPDRAKATAMSQANVKSYVAAQLTTLESAALALQNGAPSPDADGWNGTGDTAAVEAMRTQWKIARDAYERIEGAIAVLFPELDESTDARYDAFIATGGDTNLFDGTGVTGMHAVERVLFSDVQPPRVVAFESALPGYQAAQYPTTETEAREFKTALLKRLVDDIGTMRTQFTSLTLDLPTAYRGVLGSIQEQLEKVNLAATGEEESRYAQITLRDMRNNLDGGEQLIEAFEPLIESTPGGEEADEKVHQCFQRLRAAYDAVAGDALPEVPAGWSSTSPTPEQLATPYGQLFSLLRTETDAASPTSCVSHMVALGALLGVPQL